MRTHSVERSRHRRRVFFRAPELEAAGDGGRRGNTRVADGIRRLRTSATRRATAATRRAWFGFSLNAWSERRIVDTTSWLVAPNAPLGSSATALFIAARGILGSRPAMSSRSRARSELSPRILAATQPGMKSRKAP